MPLLIDQDRIIVPPGKSGTATVWVENSTNNDASFSLEVRPADHNLSQDWYQCKIEPENQSVPQGTKRQFTVTLSPKHSPDGKTRLVEFLVQANQTVVGAYVPPPPKPKQSDDAAFDAAGEPAYNPDEDLLTGSMLGVSTAPEPPPAEVAVEKPPEEPKVEPPPGPAPIPLRQDGGWGGGNVTLSVVQKASARTNAQAAQTVNAVDPSGAAGMLWTGSIYLYVPPVPTFDLAVQPYTEDNKKKKKKAPPKDLDGAPLMAGRERGDFTVRVTNQDRFPASFRLSAVGPDGCQYHVQEQILRIPPGGSQETLLTAEPNHLYWFFFARLFRFQVEATPVTGAESVDLAATIERPAVFKQLTAWLHPATFITLGVAALLLAYRFGAPEIMTFDADQTFVLRDPFVLTKVPPEGQVAAQEALIRFGEQSQSTLRWDVRNYRRLELEYDLVLNPSLNSPTSGKKTEEAVPVDLPPDAVREKSLLVTLEEPTGKNAAFIYRLTAYGWLPWTKRTRQISLPVFLSRKAGAELAIEKPELTVTAEVEQTAKVYQHLRSVQKQDEIARLVVLSTLSDPEQFRLVQPDELNGLSPREGRKNWEFEFEPLDEGTHVCWVTVVTNAQNGTVRQYKIVGKAAVR
jgi:hypothetical protein